MWKGKLFTRALHRAIKKKMKQWEKKTNPERFLPTSKFFEVKLTIRGLRRTDETWSHPINTYYHSTIQLIHSVCYESLLNSNEKNFWNEGCQRKKYYEWIKWHDTLCITIERVGKREVDRRKEIKRERERWNRELDGKRQQREHPSQLRTRSEDWKEGL